MPSKSFRLPQESKTQIPIVSHLSLLIDEGQAASSPRAFDLWSTKVTSFLRSAASQTEASEFAHLRSPDEWELHALRLGHLQGFIARTEAKFQAAANAPTGLSAVLEPPISQLASDSNRVFVVHGHDNEAKESVARFVERLELTPIILHEQPSGGRTIIEKFEKFSGSVAFAVVLLKPDDVGAASTNSNNLQRRARQNVVLELGYFMGRLGRDHVCALHKGGIELPSDYQGVIYIELDASGAWKAKLAQELVQAKLPINLAGILGG